jgi:hypothetical protein
MKPTHRHLVEDENTHAHDDDHSHNNNGHHDHDHDHSSTSSDGMNLSEIKNGQRNISNLRRLGKRRELQTTTTATATATTMDYHFQVDMYIEVDFELCAKHGETCTNGVGPKTLNYINVLFAGANSVYEVRETLNNPEYTSFTAHLTCKNACANPFVLMIYIYMYHHNRGKSIPTSMCSMSMSIPIMLPSPNPQRPSMKCMTFMVKAKHRGTFPRPIYIMQYLVKKWMVALHGLEHCAVLPMDLVLLQMFREIIRK